jgi:hypothetical protein
VSELRRVYCRRVEREEEDTVSHNAPGFIGQYCNFSFFFSFHSVFTSYSDDRSLMCLGSGSLSDEIIELFLAQ